MRCRRARHLLTTAEGAPAGGDALDRHLTGCHDCRRFAERWSELRRELRDRHARILPDAGFAARVTARLEGPTDPFVWASRRLLPATLALTLVLGGWCLLRTPSPDSLAEQLADGDLLSWVASGPREDR